MYPPDNEIMPFPLRQWWPHICAVVGFLLLSVVSILFWLELSKRFPRVHAGSYLGTFEGLGVTQTDLLNFYLERAPGSDDLLVVVLKNGWEPQVITPIASDPGQGDSGWLLPVTLAGPDEKLQLVGSEKGEGRYAGRVLNVDRGGSGQWSLRKLEGEIEAPLEPTLSDLKLRLLLTAELLQTADSIQRAETRVPEQRQEIEKLTELLTEGSRLKSRANDKYTTVHDELQHAQELLSQKRTEVKQLSDSLELSQRVTSMGKLVQLARDSLEREWRWVDSMMRTSHDETVPGLEASLERAHKLRDLRGLILNERRLIDELVAGPQAG